MKKKIGKERKEIKIAKLVRCRFHFTEYREKYEMNSYNREYVLMKCENCYERQNINVMAFK